MCSNTCVYVDTSVSVSCRYCVVLYCTVLTVGLTSRLELGLYVIQLCTLACRPSSRLCSRRSVCSDLCLIQ